MFNQEERQAIIQEWIMTIMAKAQIDWTPDELAGAVKDLKFHNSLDAEEREFLNCLIQLNESYQ